MRQNAKKAKRWLIVTLAALLLASFASGCAGGKNDGGKQGDLGNKSLKQNKVK